MTVTPIFDASVVKSGTTSTNTFIDTGIIDGTGVVVTSWSTAVVVTSWSTAVMTWGVNTGISVEQTAAMIRSSGDLAPISGTDVLASVWWDSKELACTKPNGSYTTPLLVSWSETLTAKTKSYIKLRNFIHYVVEVSNGEKYYFYHNCSNGVATVAKRVYGNTQIAISNWQIYFK